MVLCYNINGENFFFENPLNDYVISCRWRFGGFRRNMGHRPYVRIVAHFRFRRLQEVERRREETACTSGADVVGNASDDFSRDLKRHFLVGVYRCQTR